MFQRPKGPCPAELYARLLLVLSSLLFRTALGEASTNVQSSSEPYTLKQVVESDGDGRTEETTILLALGILTGGFWALMLLVSCYMRCRRNSQAKKAKTPKKKLTAEEIERRFPKNFTESTPTCVVCLGTVEANDPCRTTQCGHIFHADCLEAWWLHKPRRTLYCPVCRTKQRRSKSKKDQQGEDDPNNKGSTDQSQEEEVSEDLEVGRSSLVLVHELDGDDEQPTCRELREVPCCDGRASSAYSGTAGSVGSRSSAASPAAGGPEKQSGGAEALSPPAVESEAPRPHWPATVSEEVVIPHRGPTILPNTPADTSPTRGGPMVVEIVAREV